MFSGLYSNNFRKRVSARQMDGGFTLVEMLVVAPLAVITIAIIVTSMITLVGDSILAQRTAVAAYNLQDTLDRIDQDTRTTTAFLDKFTFFQTGQGRLATATNMSDTTSFEAKFENSAKGDLILNSLATTSDPYDSSRKIVYYQDQPNACNASNVHQNRPLSVRVIYFTRDDGKGNNTKTLWRRTILPAFNRNSGSPDERTVCADPFQKSSCPIVPAVSPGECKVVDEVALENVTSFDVTYFTSANVTETTSTRNAKSVKVSITVKETAAGQTSTQTGSTVAERTSGLVDEVPSDPVIYVDRPDDNTMNNPIKASFAWPQQNFSGTYTVQYSTNAGMTWSAPASQQNASLSIAVRPGNAVRVRVTAQNDIGTSNPVTFSHTVPIWTKLNLSLSWNCFDPTETTYSCPSYTVTGSNIVVFRGAVKDGTWGSEMFRMPSGLSQRTGYGLVVPTVAGQGAGKLTMTAGASEGSAKWDRASSTATTEFVTLDNLMYPASFASVSWSDVSLYSTNGWSQPSATYGNVQYTKDTQERTWIQGMPCGSTTVASGAQLLTVPSNFQRSNTLMTLWGNLAGTATGTGTSSLQLRTGSASQIQTRNNGWPGACPGGWQSLNLMYHSVTSSASTTSISPAAPWVNYSPTQDSGYSWLSAKKGGAGDNIVTLSGLIKDSTFTTSSAAYTTAQTLGTLPPNLGLRPLKRLSVYTMGAYQNASGVTTQPLRIDIDPNGTISIEVNGHPFNGAYLTLENISFLADGN